MVQLPRGPSLQLLRRWLLSVLLGSLPWTALRAQGGVVTGLHYFAVENFDSRQVEQRGRAGSAGIAFTNLILGNNRRYRLWVVSASTLRIATVEVATGNNGSTLELPDFVLAAPNPHDEDEDGLPNECEFVVGTDPKDADWDNDGIPDGAEVIAGSDPFGGEIVATGVVAVADTPGTALDIVAVDDIAVVADGAFGMTLFNVFNTMDPRILARVDTGGLALRVAYSGRRVGIADGLGGLVVVDVSDPPAAQIQTAVPSLLLGGGMVQAITAAADVAYCGTNTGALAAVDMVSGQILKVVQVGQEVVDVQISGDHLYALTAANELRVHRADPATLAPVSTLATAYQIAGRRLFVGGGRAYAVHGTGPNEIDCSNPAAPVLVRVNTTSNGWSQFVPNGSGLGLAIAGANAAPAVLERDLWRFDISNQAVPPAFENSFATPGAAKAVAVFNGLAYVADDDRGLEVFRYRTSDIAGNPPAITLAPSFGLGPVEEGKRVFVAANTIDDVQVRNVEFYVDGQRVFTDGGFPFEHYFVVPSLAQQSNFRLRARASDTGGNSTWTPEILVTITADATPPQVSGRVPAPDSVVSSVQAVIAFFDEPLQPATVTTTTLQLVEAGPDQVFGTSDDVLVTAGVVEFRPDTKGAFRTLLPSLPPGRYRATATTGLLDLAGNPLAAPVAWNFSTFDPNGVDTDGDGLPDALEGLLGLSPTNPDTNGNGTPDGDEDFDGDGLTNRQELLLGTDLRNGDSNNNGIADGAEDPDFDLLTNTQEFTFGTGPFVRDTDGDGFGDSEEANVGGSPSPLSDPTNAASIPLRETIGTIAIRQDLLPELHLRSVLVSATVQNQAAPDQVSRSTQSKITSVRNQ